MIQKENIGGQQLKDLEERERSVVKDRERLEKQLAEVARVAGEMENYYMGEIRSKNEVISQQQ